MAWRDDDNWVDIEIDPSTPRRPAAAPLTAPPPPRHTGILRSWHSALRYGHIEPSDGSPEVFVHRSAFAADAPAPAVGDVLSFEVRRRDGRIQALRVRRESRRSIAIAEPSGARRHLRRPSRPHNNRQASIGVAVLLMFGVFWGVGGPEALGWRSGRDLASELQTLEPTAAGRPGAAAVAPVQAPVPTPMPAPATPSTPRPEPVLATQPQVQPRAAAPSWRCDGRTTCSQMTSCAEASWFLANCPDVKMDGNRDGVPCEQQWCR